MNKSLLMSSVLIVAVCQTALAQTRAVSGRVTDQKTGEGLPGVTVLLKNTTNGVSTNADGAYSITIPDANGTLVFSSVGYVAQERIIGKETQISLALIADVKQLNEVVVTALGIEKDTRELGYATQQIKGSEISQKSDPNVLDALQGKVSGVSITTASGLPGASTNINIRGITSLQGSNQPLFVVDGIPISNDLDRSLGGAGLGSLGAAQTSNRALDLDPEIIASINILKGPAAAALYGSRAAAGAIIITTKNGSSANKKLEVTVTSSLNLQNVYGLARLQNDYGQGTSGIVTTAGGNGDIYTASGSSFGPRFGTTPTLANGLLLTNGTQLPYQAYPNNIKDFYRQGRIWTNGVNIAGGNADQNVSLNVNNTNQKGITDNSDLNRTNVSLGANTKLLNKLRVGGSINFIQTDQTGVLQGNNGSAFATLSNRVPRSLNLQGLPYVDPITGGNQFFAGVENPYFSVNLNPTTSSLTRFINVATLGYDVAPWMTVTYRAGLDTYTDRRKQLFAIGSVRQPTGQVQDQSFYRSEFNSDLIVTLKKDNILTEGFNATLLLGQNVNQRRFQSISSQGDNLVPIPGYTNAAAAAVFNVGTGESSSLRRILGYYGQLSLGYKNYLFAELTGRIDQSSTLPKANNTFFYPSATLSFVFTDALKISSSVFSYGKLRANIAKVGRDAEPYATVTYYNPASQGNNVSSISFPFTANGTVYPGFATSSTLGSSTLTPEFTRSYEVGTNLGFFNNRLNFDLGYFYTISEQQILPVTLAATTGYNSVYANVGRLENRGFEALMNFTAIKSPKFHWDITANFTRIRNLVTSITDGVTSSSINGAGFIGSIPSYRVGQPYGVIIGNALQRVQANDPVTGVANDPQYVGKYVINPASGTFDTGTANSIIADPNRKWEGGITNTFSYRGIDFSFLVDAKYGGELLSFTNASLKSTGNLYETGIDRDVPRVIPGVIRNADGTYRPNNIQIDAQAYWAASGGLQSQLNVYDATAYRLREVTLGYSLPKTLLDRTPFGQVRFSLSGRNLFYYAPNANFDPEQNTQGAGNIRGLELQGAPNTRNYGANIRFTL